MAKVKGILVAARPRTIETRRGVNQSYQVAYVPTTDEHGFPAVMNVSLEVYGQLQALGGGEQIELEYIETPPYNDKLAIKLLPPVVASV